MQTDLSAARTALDGSFAWIEGGGGRLNYSYVDNVVDALILAAAQHTVSGHRFIINDGVLSFREFLAPLLGDRARDLPSFTEQELDELRARRVPGVRDFVAALANRQLLDLVNRTPLLAASKRILRRSFRRSYGYLSRLRDNASSQSRTRSQEATTSGLPPDWLADIFGPLKIEYSSERARTVLGWQPLVSFEEGCRLSIEWLEFLGLYSAAAAGARDEEASEHCA